MVSRKARRVPRKLKKGETIIFEHGDHHGIVFDFPTGLTPDQQRERGVKLFTRSDFSTMNILFQDAPPGPRAVAKVIDFVLQAEAARFRTPRFSYGVSAVLSRMLPAASREQWLEAWREDLHDDCVRQRPWWRRVGTLQRIVFHSAPQLIWTLHLRRQPVVD